MCGFKIPVYVNFVRRLMLNADAPVFLIAEGHLVHRSKAILQLAAESNGRLCPFSWLLIRRTWIRMSSYGVHHKNGEFAIKDHGHLKQRVRAVLRSLQKILALI
ncbi:hypothetical protein WT83_32075 [Burkholderia territorii]|uniref:Transposase n=1 Tax=Burkholderia territorii TaxID=1503055 RepID=A0A108E2J4_9BURK|nr:hypothetical protein [Burkholderia territorii]KWN03533.1 hypothetical protein WT83_32075 [Burkholderia territorii]